MGLEFVLGLADRMSAPAKEAEGALSSLEKQIRSETDALSKLERSMSNLQKGSSVDIGTQKSLSAAISSKRDKLAGLETKVVGLGNAEEGASASSQGLAASLEGIGGVLGPIVAVIGTLVVGLGALVVAGGSMAIAATDFKGDMIDAYEAINGVAESGDETFAAIDALAKSIPGPAEKVHASAKKIMAQGVTDMAMVRETLLAQAGLQAAGLNEGAAKLESIVAKAATGGKIKLDAKQLADAGVTLDQVVQQMVAKTGKNAGALKQALKEGTVNADEGIAALNAAVNQRYGKLAAKNMKDLDVQAQKFKDNLGRMFSGSSAGQAKLFDALSDLGKLFDESSASGKVMKSVITQGFDFIFSSAAKVLPYVKEGFLRLALAAVNVAIFMKPGVALLEKMFETKGKGVELKDLFVVLEFAVKAVVGGLLAGAIIVVGFFKMMSAGWDLAGDAINWVGTQLSDLWDGLSDGMANVIDVFAEITATATGWWESLTGIFAGSETIGTDFVDGLVNGITGGVERVVEAAGNLARGAIGAVTGLLKTSSPSMVMHGIGGDTGEGMAIGVEEETPRVQGALERMVTPPAVPSLPDAIAPTLQNVIAPIAGASPANENGAPGIAAAVTPANDIAASGIAGVVAPDPLVAPPVNLASPAVDVGGPTVNVGAPNIPAPVVAPPSVNVASPATKGTSAGPTNVEMHVTINGTGQSADQIVDVLEERMTAFFERSAAAMGAEEAA